MTVKKSIWASTAEYIVTLPCGVVVDNEIQREVTLTPFSVADRKALGDKSIAKNPAKVTTRILKSKIQSIGKITQITDALLRSLDSFDRDYLLYKLRNNAKAGADFALLGVECPHCSELLDSFVPVSEIEDTYKPMPDSARMLMSGGKGVFEVVLDEYEMGVDEKGDSIPFKASFRYITGDAQEKAIDKMSKGRNMAEYELQLISDLCISWNGSGPISTGKLGTLDVGFLSDLKHAMDSIDYGCQYAPEITCYSCDKVSNHQINVLDFLDHGPKSTTT